MAGGGDPARYLLSRKPRVEVKKLEGPPGQYKLHVGNLTPEVTEAELQQAFAKYLSLRTADVPKDKDGRSRGYGFVSFASADEYLLAYREMNHEFVGGRRIELSRGDAKRRKGKQRTR